MMSRWVTAKKHRSQSSTGARISAGRFQPSSPKGGYLGNIYEGARYLDERYGYRTESYYKKRLFGDKKADIDWRYDLNKRLIGRPDYKSRASFPWLPRFPKKQYTSQYGKVGQVYSKRGSSFGSGRSNRSDDSKRYRFRNYRTIRSYRFRCTHRCQDCKIRDMDAKDKCGFNKQFHSLVNTKNRVRSITCKPYPRRWQSSKKEYNVIRGYRFRQRRK